MRMVKKLAQQYGACSKQKLSSFNVSVINGVKKNVIIYLDFKNSSYGAQTANLILNVFEYFK